MYSKHYDVYSKYCDVYSLETSLENDIKVSNFSKFGWQLLNFFSDFRATFGFIVKQLLLDLRAQSIHAYLGALEKTDCTSML